MIKAYWKGIKKEHRLLCLDICSDTITDKEVIKILNKNQYYRKVYATVWNDEQSDVLFHRGFERESTLEDHYGEGVNGEVWCKFDLSTEMNKLAKIHKKK